MNKVELIVGLKIPDTTAITAFHTIHNLGYTEVTKLKRYVYHSFETEENVDEFQKKLVKTDLLVNANKNTSETFTNGLQMKNSIIVKDIDNTCEGLKSSLEKLGYTGIKKIEHGVLWVFEIDNNTPAESIKKIAQELLANKHFQKVEYL